MQLTEPQGNFQKKILNFTTPFSISIFTTLFGGSAADIKTLMHKILSAKQAATF